MLVEQYRIGDFSTALSGLVESMNGISERLGQCDPRAVIDRTPGRTAICQGPPIKGDACLAEIRDPFTVADLVEWVEGLRDWIGDVQARLENYDASTPLDGGAWSGSETAD
jgi:hypothetical protein